MTSEAREGKYIVLEGGEGVGKSTQVRELVGKCAVLGYEAVSVFEPGSSEIGANIRGLVLGFDDIDLKTELLLFNAARVETLREVRSHLGHSRHVLSDRSALSTIVYQGYARGLPLDDVRRICDFAVGETVPDLQLVLDAPFDTTQSRRTVRSADDRFEALDTDFHKKIYEAYLIEAERLGAPVVSADGTVEQVTERIWQHVEPLLKRGADG